MLESDLLCYQQRYHRARPRYERLKTPQVLTALGLWNATIQIPGQEAALAHANIDALTDVLINRGFMGDVGHKVFAP